LPLLHLYCAAVAQAKLAAEQVEAALQAGEGPEPWFKIQTTAMRSVTMLSARLRIGPRSRSNNQRSAKSGRSPSAYETLGLTELQLWEKT
jgi:hypothetical protein